MCHQAKEKASPLHSRIRLAWTGEGHLDLQMVIPGMLKVLQQEQVELWVEEAGSSWLQLYSRRGTSLHMSGPVS